MIYKKANGRIYFLKKEYLVNVKLLLLGALTDDTNTGDDLKQNE